MRNGTDLRHHPVLDSHVQITRKYSTTMCSMCSCSDQRSQNNLLWSMKGVESLRMQSFKGFWKSRKIPGLDLWESRDRDLEKIPGSRDILGSRRGLTIRRSHYYTFSFYLLSFFFFFLKLLSIIYKLEKWRCLLASPLHPPLDALTNLVWHSDTSRWLVHRSFLSDRDSIKTWYVTSGASSPTHPTISSLSKHPQLSILYTSPPRPEPSKALAVHNASE